MASAPVVGGEFRPGFCPKRTQVVTLDTQPPLNSTVLCVDELGPISPRTFPPAPGWSRDGHRIKAPLEYSRGFDKTWVYGALRIRDGQELTLSAPSRNTQGYLQLLTAVDQANPDGQLYLITDNLSSHSSAPIRLWLANHPRIHQVFIPKRACWLNLQEAWWRLFRREALAGQTFADHGEIERATRVATQQLNQRAKPWIWQRSASIPRHYRRIFVYRI